MRSSLLLTGLVGACLLLAPACADAETTTAVSCPLATPAAACESALVQTPNEHGIPNHVGVVFAVSGAPASLGGSYPATWMAVQTDDSGSPLRGGCAGADTCAEAATRIVLEAAGTTIVATVSIPADRLAAVAPGTPVQVTEFAWTGPGSLPEEGIDVSDEAGVIVRIGELKSPDPLDTMTVVAGPLTLRAGATTCRPPRDMCLRQYGGRDLEVSGQGVACTTLSAGGTVEVQTAAGTYAVHNARVYERLYDEEQAGACTDRSNGHLEYWIARQ